MAGAVSLGAISALMVATDLALAPAASTALMIALGAFAGWHDLLVMMAAVSLLAAQAIVINRLSGVSYPLRSPRSGTDGDDLAVRALETAAPGPARSPEAAGPGPTSPGSVRGRRSPIDGGPPPGLSSIRSPVCSPPEVIPCVPVLRHRARSASRSLFP